MLLDLLCQVMDKAMFQQLRYAPPIPTPQLDHSLRSAA